MQIHGSASESGGFYFQWKLTLELRSTQVHDMREMPPEHAYGSL